MKENKTMVVDTKLNIVDFVSIVNDIALEYFDEKNNYTPHIGLLNDMRLFYNYCVKESKFDNDIPHNITDAIEMEDIVADAEFIEAFNEALKSSGYGIDFATARLEGMNIVEQKKTSVFGAVELIRKIISDVVDNMNSVMNPENIDKITSLISTMGNGNINMNDIMKLLGQATDKVDKV